METPEEFAVGHLPPDSHSELRTLLADEIRARDAAQFRAGALWALEELVRPWKKTHACTEAVAKFRSRIKTGELP